MDKLYNMQKKLKCNNLLKNKNMLYLVIDYFNVI